MRKIAIPAHRYTPLRNDWLKICTPIVHNLKLQIRVNTKSRKVEIKVRNVYTFRRLETDLLNLRVAFVGV